MNFKIPDYKELTDDEKFVMSDKWFTPHKGINPMEWNDILKENTFPLHLLKLPKELAIDMVNGKDVSNDFCLILDAFLAVHNLKDSFFIKLITRSPKDFLDENFEITDSRSAYKALSYSLRTSEDLAMLSNLDMCWLVIRPFVEMERINEFRVMIYANNIAGISQYYYADDTIIQNPDNIDKLIRDFVDNTITPNVPLNSFVVDIVFIKEKLYMIELNPFGLSDPCMFISYDKLDGSFKCNK